MPPFRLLAALLALALHLCAQAATTVTRDTFSGASTINANPTTPSSPTATALSYQQLAAKTFNPNPPAITAGNLRFGIVATSSGFNHLQALFTKYPVTLVNTGDYIELTVNFSTEGGIITAQTNSTLFFGLHNAGQVQSKPGGMNGTVATATAGYAQTWQGYVNRIFYAGGSNGFYTRPSQTATAANNQDVLYNYASAAGVGSTATSTLAAFTAGAQFTEVFRITRASATAMTLSSSLYAGTAAAGMPLYTQTATSTSILTNVFDAFAIGWRATGSVPSVMNISAVKITTTGTTTIVPEILAQPFSRTKMVGESVSFTVAADGGAGTTLSYQWKKNGADIAGATAATYDIAGVTLADAADYSVVVSNVAGSTTSNAATLTVTTGAVAPSIVTPPAGATILAGGSHMFSTTVNGTAPLFYQWQKSTDTGANYANIAGATGTSYSISNATLADAGLYRIVVTNGQGSTTSSAAELVILQAPTITSQPAGGTLNPGGGITLSVTASGTPAPSYQWKKNGAAIAGATSASYVIASASGANAGNYAVVVTNSVGFVTSATASIVVLSPALAATSVTPASAATGLNPDTRLSITFNAPVTPGVSGVLRIHDASNDSVVDTIDLVAATALRDTLRAQGTISTQLLPVQSKPIGGLPINFNYYPITVAGNTATIHPRNGVLAYGKTYYVKAEPGVFLNAAGESFPGIADSTTWRFSTKASGPAAGATSLTVAADGSGDFNTLQAALDFVPANNAVPTTIRLKNGTYFEEIGFQAKHFITILGEDVDQTVITYPNNNTFNNASGVYHRATLLAQSVHDFTIANLTIHNTTPQNGSQAEAIVINGTSATTGRNIVTGCKFYSYQDTVQFNKQTYISDSTIWGDVDFLWGDGPSFFENCDIRVLRNGGIFTQIRNDSSRHGYVFRHCRFTAPAGISGTFFGRIDPAGFPYSEVVVLDSSIGDATNNSLLAIATGASGSNYLAGWWLLNNATSASAAPNVHNWSNHLLDGFGAALTNPNSSAFTTMPTDATTQANYRDPTWVLNTSLAGAMNGSWTPALAPLIVSAPTAQVVNAGDAVTFAVAVVAIPQATYQWKKNGNDLAGATAATYTIPLARGTDTGGYTVVVSNSAGSVTTSEATLTITGELVAPTITTPPASQLIAEGASGTLSVAALGTAPLSYQWEKNGSPIAGATTSSYAITNAALTDAGNYRVVVTNTVGSETSTVAIISVKGIAATAKSGYAASVTGGAAGSTVTVSTAAGLKTYAESTTPYTIVVSGTIDLGPGGRMKLQSNKTLRGATTSSTILGTITISNATNVIVSNLNISANTGLPSENDGITIASSTNVLVTKCTIYDCTDGNLDVINGSDLVTVSWCRFYYTRNNGHNFSNLIGSSDTDVGSGDGRTNYRVTWHHNWWSAGAKQRMIACRFGSAHMFNNYWDCSGNDYATESRNIAAMFSEHNYYDGVKNPLAKRTALGTDDGLLMTIGNIFDACTGSQFVSGDLVFSPPYSYGLNAAASVPALVKAGAGNVTTDAAAASSATIASSAPFGTAGGSLTLTGVAAGFTPASYQWRFNNAPIAGATSATLELTNIQSVHAGTYTVVHGLSDGDAVVSAPHVLAVKAPPALTMQPASQTATVGETVSFTVAATGDAPLAYQWNKNGTAIAGATAATIERSNVTTADAGDYRCVVTNIAGSATSNAATLTVQKATATVAVASASVVFDGSVNSASVTTTPAGLPLTVTYNGSTVAPVNAGSYAVSATVVHADYIGSGTGTLEITPAPAAVALGALAQTYDGTPKSATAVTAPAGLPVTLTYNGTSTAPTAAGSYAVVGIVNHANYTGSASGTLTIAKATATIALAPLPQRYDGTPRSVTATTTPAGLTVNLTYDGVAAAPIYPGPHAIVATIADANYSGTATETLVVGITALVRHAPTLNGDLDGSLQVLLPESVTLNGGAMISGDLLVPGTPVVQLNGSPTYGSTLDATGDARPSSHTITLNGGAVLRHVVRRVDAIALPTVAAPAAPAGTRDVTINKSTDTAGDFATLRHLTLNGNAGTVAVPAGVYGTFTASGNSRLVLGVTGASEPALYDLQSLTLHGNASLEIVGPVILTLANGPTLDGRVGAAEHPEWLTLRVASGGISLNGNAALYGYVVAPTGPVVLNGSSRLVGSVKSDALVLDGNGQLEDAAR